VENSPIFSNLDESIDGYPSSCSLSKNSARRSLSPKASGALLRGAGATLASRGAVFPAPAALEAVSRSAVPCVLPIGNKFRAFEFDDLTRRLAGSGTLHHDPLARIRSLAPLSVHRYPRDMYCNLITSSSATKPP